MQIEHCSELTLNLPTVFLKSMHCGQKYAVDLQPPPNVVVYLQRGFRITKVHADDEMQPLQALIANMPRRRMINLASADEHVPEIEWKIRVVKE
jgi:hypothetical protein